MLTTMALVGIYVRVWYTDTYTTIVNYSKLTGTIVNYSKLTHTIVNYSKLTHTIVNYSKLTQSIAVSFQIKYTSIMQMLSREVLEPRLKQLLMTLSPVVNSLTL